jgi:DNA-binding MurR/RpiR family transcriptional regulator
MLRPEVGLLPLAGQTLGEDLVDVDGTTVLVAFAFRRRVPVLPRLLAHAAAAGARRLVLTDRTATRSIDLASWAVPCEVEGSGPLDSYAAAASVANLLCAATFARLGPAARRRLAATERLHGEFEELDTAPLTRLGGGNRA